MYLNYNLIVNKCTKMEFELWVWKNCKNLTLIQSRIYENPMRQSKIWSSMKWCHFVWIFRKWGQMLSSSIQKWTRPWFLRPTSNFCQSAILWPTKSTRRSKRCVFFPATQHQMNPYSFDLAKCIDFSTRIPLTYECEFMWTRSKQCGLFWLDAINSSSYFDIRNYFK